MRVHAAAAERTLASAAGRSAVRWSFRVARGIAATELLAAALGAAAQAAGHEVRLLLFGDASSPATRWAEAARSRSGPDSMRLSVVHTADLAELASALKHDLPGVVVLMSDEAVLSRRDLDALLREAAVPVLILPVA